MNLISILRDLDDHKITFQDAANRLTKECGADFLASAYLSCRMQRESLRGRLNAYEDAEQPKRLDRATIETLIEEAYLADAISQAAAFVYLTKDGVPDGEARARLETLAAIKNKDAERAKYLKHPDTAKRYCTVCGRQLVAAALSKRGICQRCSDEIRNAVIVQMTAKSGPYFNAWRDGMMRFSFRLADEEIAEQDTIRDAEPQMEDDNADLTECSRYPGLCYRCDDYGCTTRYEPYEGNDYDYDDDTPF